MFAVMGALHAMRVGGGGCGRQWLACRAVFPGPMGRPTRRMEEAVSAWHVGCMAPHWHRSRWHVPLLLLAEGGLT